MLSFEEKLSIIKTAAYSGCFIKIAAASGGFESPGVDLSQLVSAGGVGEAAEEAKALAYVAKALAKSRIPTIAPIAADVAAVGSYTSKLLSPLQESMAAQEIARRRQMMTNYLLQSGAMQDKLLALQKSMKRLPKRLMTAEQVGKYWEV